MCDCSPSGRAAPGSIPTGTPAMPKISLSMASRPGFAFGTLYQSHPESKVVKRTNQPALTESP